MFTFDDAKEIMKPIRIANMTGDELYCKRVTRSKTMSYREQYEFAVNYQDYQGSFEEFCTLLGIESK